MAASQSTDSYDAIVVGLGGMGSAAAYHLASRGADVLGLEQFDIPHGRGSSHGHSRTIGRSFYEAPEYMALYERTRELWEEVEAASGERLLVKTGSLTTGEPGTQPVSKAIDTCESFGLPHEILDPDTVADRFPGYEIPDSHDALFQPDDGYIRPTAATLAHVELAQEAGAQLQAREAVTEWEPHGDGVRVHTTRGSYTAASLVLTAGPWLPSLVAEFGGTMVAERRVLARFQPGDLATFQPDAFPVSSVTTSDGRFGAWPVEGVPGVKVAGGTEEVDATDPDEVAEPTQHDEAPLRRFAERCLDGAAGPTMQLKTCLYTNTPDEDPVVDRHPDHPQVALAGGFSGHGYKFTPVMGEILADLTLDGETDHDVSLFGFGRF